MKSGYHWAHSRSGIHRHSSIQLVPERVWKCIWKLNVPQKIRNFLWKSVHRALSSMVDLFKRKSSPSPICPICNISEESVKHMFIRCPWVAVICFGGPLNHRVDSVGNLTWVQWLLSLLALDSWSYHDTGWVLSYAAFTCWHIWKARCNIFNQVPINPHQVMFTISLSTGAFFLCYLPPIGRPSSEGDAQPQIWTPPPLSFY